MQGDIKPDPRWSEYIEVFDQHSTPIGFRLPNIEHLFKYEPNGGWYDQKGRFYNAEGILQDQVDSVSDGDEDYLSDHQDDLVEKFQELLREEEEGIIRRGTSKKTNEEPKKVQNESKDASNSKEDSLNFGKLLEQYNSSQDRLRQGIPKDLFIYFRQIDSYYKRIIPQVQKQGDVSNKKQIVKKIKLEIQSIRKQLFQKNSWLKSQNTFLDYSGDSDEPNQYDRYWYGYIKTSSQNYLSSLQAIKHSKEFRILEIKTYYALRSKLYLKKSQQKIKKNISDLASKVAPIPENHTASLLIDGLPQRFPVSYIYDLIEYSGGKLQQVESVIVEDDFSATVTALRSTALQIIKLEGYNHDKGQYIEISFNQSKPVAQKRNFYYISVDNQYKIHERELQDTLALEPGKQEAVKHATKQEEETNHYRFVVGSVSALRKVLMFRGESLNVVKVLPAPQN